MQVVVLRWHKNTCKEADVTKKPLGWGDSSFSKCSSRSIQQFSAPLSGKAVLRARVVARSSFVLFDVVVSIDSSMEMGLCDWFIIILFPWILRVGICVLQKHCRVIWDTWMTVILRSFFFPFCPPLLAHPVLNWLTCVTSHLHSCCRVVSKCQGGS